MNRYRSEPATHISVFITLILAALVVVTGGIMHVVAKNSQIQVEREIDKAQKRIEQTRIKIHMIEVNADKELDRYVMREKLAQKRSTLVPVTHADLETVTPSARPAAPPGVEVAAAQQQP